MASTAARVVVGAGAAGDGVVVGADENDLVVRRLGATSDLQIGARDPVDFVDLPGDVVALGPPIRLDVG